jgi:hypothetical protein
MSAPDKLEERAREWLAKHSERFTYYGHESATGAPIFGSLVALLREVQREERARWRKAADSYFDDIRPNAELIDMYAGGEQDLPTAIMHEVWKRNPKVEAEVERLRAEVERVKLLLGKAAQEIHCAGPVDHRIRVMRREHSELVTQLTARIKAVLALHKPHEEAGYLHPVCAECRQSPWPCPTRRALEGEP